MKNKGKLSPNQFGAGSGVSTKEWWVVEGENKKQQTTFLVELDTTIFFNSDRHNRILETGSDKEQMNARRN